MEEWSREIDKTQHELNALLELVETQMLLSKQVIDTHMPRIMQLSERMKLMRTRFTPPH